MKILVLRTDKPRAEVGIFENNKQLVYEKWEAHLRLAETIHVKLAEILNPPSPRLRRAGLQNISLEDLQGIVVYSGPGSFTGLRIGISVANALAGSLSIPIVSTSGEDWIISGIKKLQNGENDKLVLPQYGAEARTTTQKK